MTWFVKVNLATLVEGDPKAPFSIATTPRCRGGHCSIPWIAPLKTWSLPYNAQCWGARGVIVIVVGSGHGDTSSNPGRDWLHFT